MSSISLNAFFLAAIIIPMAVIIALWIYYDRLDSKLCDRQRVRHIYRCIKCGKLYDRRGHREVAPCPDCGFTNDRLRF
jgi:hypothetical protein